MGLAAKAMLACCMLRGATLAAGPTLAADVQDVVYSAAMAGGLKASISRQSLPLG